MHWYRQAWRWDTFAWVSLKSVYIFTAMSNIVDFRTTWISPCQSAIGLQKQSDIIASDQSALAQSISNFSALALLGKFGLHPNILPRAEIILHISDVSWNESPKGNATGNLRAEEWAAKSWSFESLNNRQSTEEKMAWHSTTEEPLQEGGEKEAYNKKAYAYQWSRSEAEMCKLQEEKNQWSNSFKDWRRLSAEARFWLTHSRGKTGTTALCWQHC